MKFVMTYIHSYLTEVIVSGQVIGMGREHSVSTTVTPRTPLLPYSPDTCPVQGREVRGSTSRIRPLLCI